MIKSEQEYLNTLESIKGFTQFIQNLSTDSNISFETKLCVDAKRAMIADLQKQIEWYKNAVEGKTAFDTIEEFDKLNAVIIGKRLQLGYSQLDMASFLNIRPAEYKYLEENEFYGISGDLFSRILEILSIKNGSHFLQWNLDNALSTAKKNIQKLNVDNSLISQALSLSWKEVLKAFSSHSESANYLFTRFVDRFNRFFALNLIKADVSHEAILESLSVAFKKTVAIRDENLNFATLYAAKIAKLISDATNADFKRIKSDPIEIRNKIINDYSKVDFDSCVRFFWDIGIPVVPLNIPKGFHGACFIFDDKCVIVLNQQTQMVSRWKFDLLHELYHALTMHQNISIDYEDAENDIDEEITASEFAYFVIFGSEVESYLEIAVDQCRDENIKYLKTQLVQVANEFGLNIDDFSNFAARRLQMQGLSWWGTAQNLQQDTRNPFAITRDIFLERFDFRNMLRPDIELLQTALRNYKDDKDE